MTEPPDDRGGGDRDKAWFRVDDRADCVVVSAGGEVDMHTSAGLVRALQASTRSSPHLIIDLTHVTFVDSTALGVLISARNRASESGGWVALVDPPEMVRRILVGTQLQRSFAVFDTLDEALESVTPRGAT
jgi:anti-sigma B factor antagonist